MTRIIITTSDIMQLTGKSQASAWREMQTIKDALGKTKKQVLTIKEYCHYNGVEESEFEKIIKK